MNRTECVSPFNRSAHFFTHNFKTFAELFVNLAMRVKAFFPKSATTLLGKQVFWWVPLFTE